MAAFGTGASRQLSGRGSAPGFRFTLYAALSIVIMFVDKRGEYFERVHYVLDAAAYPIQLAVTSPSTAWQWLQGSLATRDQLRAENARLLARDRELEVRSMRYEALARENDQLRGLRDALPPVADRWLVAEIVDIQLNNLRQRVVINRGTTNGVFKGQAILDDKGLLGQTTHVGPWSAEVILITDSEHAVPVQIERTGLRTIAVGTGDTASLALPYLPANADVKTGDVLMTSGLGGVFPAGYPVGRVTEVHRDAVQPLAQVLAVPYASMEKDREVMLVWFREGHPAAPVVASTGDAQSGNSRMQPQTAPKRSAASSPAATASNLRPPEAATGSPGDAATLPPSPKTPVKPATAAEPQLDEESPPIVEDGPQNPEPQSAPSVSGTPSSTQSSTSPRKKPAAGAHKPPPSTASPKRQP